MTRRLQILAIAAAMGALLAAPAAAGPPALFDNEYEGRAERDPNTYVGFDVFNGGGGKKVGKVTALLRYTCTNGESGSAPGRVRGKLRVEAGAFAGTLRGQLPPIRAMTARGPSPTGIKYRVKGRLLKQGKARGTIDATLRFAATRARGVAQVRCYTGELDWRAKRGADVLLPS